MFYSKNVYVPKVFSSTKMNFIQIKSFSDLNFTNDYKILEPTLKNPVLYYRE